MSIKFRMAAWSEAAGRPNNEDSFLVSKNISGQDWVFTTNETLSLDEKGAVLVVCDGMGGMNAGEVASAIAVETVKEWFSPEKLTADVTQTPEAIRHYIDKTIIAADKKIKEEADADVEKGGMGTTLVLAWIVEKHVYVGWCGDSRAYRYNPVNGLERLSHDHSYVQELVDAGKLTPEMAMEHPQSNIITRSLGDTQKEAQPDTNYHPLCTNDIILLCSDGLCGIMHDHEIEAVLEENAKDMGLCRDALLAASEKKGWTDNVTITLCQIVSGGAKAIKKDVNREERIVKKRFTKILFTLGIIAVLVLLGYEGGYFRATKSFWIPGMEIKCDSIPVKIVTDTTNIVIPPKQEKLEELDAISADKRETDDKKGKPNEKKKVDAEKGEENQEKNLTPVKESKDTPKTEEKK